MKTIVITGIGMINGVGNSAERSFEALLEGVCGIDRITLYNAGNDAVQIASEVKGFDPAAVMDAKDIKKSDRFIHLGMHALKEALADAALTPETGNPERMGVSAATGIGGLPMIQDNIEKNAAGKKISPFFIPGTITNMLAGYASIYYDLRGPNLSATTGGASCHQPGGEDAHDRRGRRHGRARFRSVYLRDGHPGVQCDEGAFDAQRRSQNGFAAFR